MGFWVWLYHVLNVQMETPTSYGWFHLLWIGLIVCGSALMGVAAVKLRQKGEKRLLFGVWIWMVLFEALKQVLFSVSLKDGAFVWDYQWYAFPFQFCSSPFFILPLAIFPKRERLRASALCFLATYSFFAGLAVFAYPNDVFVSELVIDLQTMTHHGAQVLLGFYAAARLIHNGQVRLKNYFGAVCLFAALVAVADVMNLLAPLVTDETFNMFFISPFYPCTLVILDRVYAALPYGLFLIVYLCGFSFAAFLVYELIAFAARLRKKKV